MKLLFVTKGDERLASARYRVLNLREPLAERGIESEWMTLSKTSNTDNQIYNMVKFAASLLLKSNFYDVIYVQKVLFPKIYLELLMKVSGPIIYDIDDAIYSRYLWTKETNENRTQKLQSTLNLVSAVTVGSPALAQYARQYTDQVYCLPTSTPGQSYTQSQLNNETQNALAAGSSVIGWIGNPSNLRYLATIEDSLGEILDNSEKTKLRIIMAGEKPVEPLANRDDVVYRE